MALFSCHGTAAWFCVFDGGAEKRIALKKSGDVFSGFVKGLRAGSRYGFRVDGPWQPEEGHRFDPSKLLVDPYATELDVPFSYRSELCARGTDTAAMVPKCVVTAGLNDVGLRDVSRPRFIYEMGVRSFSMLNMAVPEALRGTVAALAHPAIIAHLKKIGADTIELMPIHAWIDERHLQPFGLHNAWGYNSVQFFALDPRVCPGGWEELCQTVAALHAHGMQVVMDVVYNHSGESDQFGPTLSFRGLDNATYYAQTGGELHNDAGTGNTLALNNPPVTEMVLASLRQAVLKAGIDGFRFDLASVLGRTDNGFEADAPLIKAITEDPVLGSRILIAEPWDVGPGGYRLGNFPNGWMEWNDQYRDGVRHFWRGDDWSANQMATRLCGSSDIFVGRKPSASINFVAAHDGFTLRDLVTFALKHNEANGEGNGDGNAAEVTWPGGNVQALLATLFLSRGTIMLTAGDEFGRTQMGNNNAYAQDNEITWLDWRNADQVLIEFLSQLNQLRKNVEFWLEDSFVVAREAFWFGVDGKAVNWNKAQNGFLGLLLTKKKKRLALVFNAGTSNLPFSVTSAPSQSWERIYATVPEPGCPAQAVSVFVES